ncbi:MAG: hemolysin family protein [Candidatus Paceibacterota bacterium]
MEAIIFVSLIAGSAFFSASETAFFSLHTSKIRLMKKQHAWNAHLIERLKKNPDRLLITVLVGNTLVNLSTATYATALAINAFGSLGLGIVTGITAVAILIAGEIVPKSIAYADNARVAQITAYPLFIFSILIWPVSTLLSAFNKKLNSFFGSKHRGHVTEDEVLIMSRMSVEKGGINYEEHAFIEKVFQFDDIPVGSAMTAFPRIHALDGEVPVENIAYHISQTEHSRYPVYKGNDKNIVGYIHVNTVMKVLNSNDRHKPIGEFASQVKKIDENMSLERAFRAMNKRGAHMFLVHKHKDSDTIVGLITLEDILEELVGEIEDETDTSK